MRRHYGEIEAGGDFTRALKHLTIMGRDSTLSSLTG